MFKGLWKRNQEKREILEEQKYRIIVEQAFNETLKQEIMKLEQVSEGLCKEYEEKYTEEFKEKDKKNLRLWIVRDIDGDESENLTSNHCLEKEYRSQIAFDYDGPKLDGDFYACTTQLWYYFGGYFHGEGALYGGNVQRLKNDIQETLIMLLNDN
ncbi:hypothetical protein J2S09_005026 [Bacillus fengqiuensis]|nr:hypothetical protein [Bacillus fengqiuensis]